MAYFFFCVLVCCSTFLAYQGKWCWWFFLAAAFVCYLLEWGSTPTKPVKRTRDDQQYERYVDAVANDQLRGR